MVIADFKYEGEQLGGEGGQKHGCGLFGCWTRSVRSVTDGSRLFSLYQIYNSSCG